MHTFFLQLIYSESLGIQTEKAKIDCAEENLRYYFPHLYHLVQPCFKTSWRQKFQVSVEFESRGWHERLGGNYLGKPIIPAALNGLDDSENICTCKDDLVDFNS